MTGRRTTILRHDTPDGRHHFDWLFAVDDPPARPLRTFRAASAPHAAAVGDRVPMTPIGDHRIRYLDYEGPISDDRGHVHVVATGRYFPAGGVDGRSEFEDLIVEIHWEGSPGPQLWRLDSHGLAARLR